jgi:hypothetical protein
MTLFQLQRYVSIASNEIIREYVNIRREMIWARLKEAKTADLRGFWFARIQRKHEFMIFLFVSLNWELMTPSV